jgi:colanic acid biosynthesis protein WcaH
MTLPSSVLLPVSSPPPPSSSSLLSSLSSSWLPQAEFEAALAVLPLVSVDWVVSNPAGSVLCGWRLNAPARNTWFTPGGRVRKGEALKAALARVAIDELGVPEAGVAEWLQRAQPMGAWDHFYEDSAFSDAAPTHYVNLPHALVLTWPEVESLDQHLPLGAQHGAWRWTAAQAQGEPLVHPHVVPYLDWAGGPRAAPEQGPVP